MAAETESSAKRSRTRSPSYPYLDLPAALEKVTVLWNVEGRHPTAVSVVMQHWGYKEESSTGYSCVAALKKFGLVDHDGMGETRQIRLSALALAILLDRDPASADRRDALRRAALNPRIHTELWERYGADLPSDQTLRRFLVIERNFNEASVDELLAEYKATVAFAGLGRGGATAAVPGALPVNPVPPPAAVLPRPALPPEAPRDLHDARERAGRPPAGSRPDREETAAPAPVQSGRALAAPNGSHGPAATDLAGYRAGDVPGRDRRPVDLFGQPEDRYEASVAEELLAPLPSRRALAPAGRRDRSRRAARTRRRRRSGGWPVVPGPPGIARAARQRPGRTRAVPDERGGFFPAHGHAPALEEAARAGLSSGASASAACLVFPPPFAGETPPVSPARRRPVRPVDPGEFLVPKAFAPSAGPV